MMNESLVKAALHQARCGWDNRNGVWPKTLPMDRISHTPCDCHLATTRRNYTIEKANQEYNDAIEFAEDVLRKYEEHKQPPLPFGIVLCWGAKINSLVET